MVSHTITRRDLLRPIGSQQELDQSRRIDDDHRESRSARIMSSTGSGVARLGSFDKRSLISAIVGRRRAMSRRATSENTI